MGAIPSREIDLRSNDSKEVPSTELRYSRKKGGGGSCQHAGMFAEEERVEDGFILCRGMVKDNVVAEEGVSSKNETS